MWSGERLTRKQLTSRPDYLWPALWEKMGKNAKLKERQKWSHEQLQFDNVLKLWEFVSLIVRTRNSLRNKKKHKHKIFGRTIFFAHVSISLVFCWLPLACTHCSEGLINMCATRSSCCTLASTWVGRDQYLRLEAETCFGRKWAACESQAGIQGRIAAPWRCVLKFMPRGEQDGDRQARQVLASFRLGPQDQRELGARLHGVKGFAHVIRNELDQSRLSFSGSPFFLFSFTLFSSFFFFLVWFGLVGFSWLSGCGASWCVVECCGVVATHQNAQNWSREKTQKLFPKHSLFERV